MKKTWAKRLFSSAVALMMGLSLMPTGAFAAGGEITAPSDWANGTYDNETKVATVTYTIPADADYEKIKKVYSIWLCMNPPMSRKNTITNYCITEDNLVGRVKERKEYYDLMSAVMVCLGEESDREQGGILKLLNILFSTESKAREKQEILEREFSIKMTKTLKREVALMCNLSQWVEEKGIKKGMERGIEATVSVLKELGINEDVILEKVKEKFSLTESQAKKYVM